MVVVGRPWWRYAFPIRQHSGTTGCGFVGRQAKSRVRAHVSRGGERGHRATGGRVVRTRQLVGLTFPLPFRLRLRISRASITSTMSIGSVDRSDPLPLHEQVAAEIRRAIADGEAEPGERLPLAKDLAAIMGVNKNTVLRALHVLRDEGLLEFRRGHGITVAGTKEKSALVLQVRELVEAARRSGYRKAELIAMIEGLPQ